MSIGYVTVMEAGIGAGSNEPEKKGIIMVLRVDSLFHGKPNY